MITLFDCGIGPNDIIIRWDKKREGVGRGSEDIFVGFASSS